jgi:hypothetical protein
MTRDPLSRLINDLTELDKKIEERMKSYSPEELLSIGREQVTDSYPNYMQAAFIFDELSKNSNGGIREISRLYKHLITSLSYPGTQNPKIADFIVRRLINCMSESTRMHFEKDISKEDLFAIDTLVDRIVSENILIPNREEFEKIYCRFKEYTLDVFLGKR